MPIQELPEVTIVPRSGSGGMNPAAGSWFQQQYYDWMRRSGYGAAAGGAAGAAAAGEGKDYGGEKDDSNPGHEGDTPNDSEAPSHDENFDHADEDAGGNDSSELEQDESPDHDADNFDNDSDEPDSDANSDWDDGDLSDLGSPESGFPDAGSGDPGVPRPDFGGFDPSSVPDVASPIPSPSGSPDFLSPTLDVPGDIAPRPVLAEPRERPGDSGSSDEAGPELVGLEADPMDSPFSPELEPLRPQQDCDCGKKKKKKKKAKPRTVCYEGKYTDRTQGIYYNALKEVPCEPKSAKSNRKPKREKAPKRAKRRGKQPTIGDLSRDIFGL
jgi:hypothetical protein